MARRRGFGRVDAVWLLAVAAGVTVPAAAAFACAVCAGADTTAGVLGTSEPEQGRSRLSAVASGRRITDGEGSAARTIDEQRLDLSVAWAPFERGDFAISVPLLHRAMTEESGAEREIFGHGDVELTTRWSLWVDDPASTTRAFRLHGGVRLPLGTEWLDSRTVVVEETDQALSGGSIPKHAAHDHGDADGEAFDPDVDVGTSAFVPFVGASFSAVEGDWSGYATATSYVPVGGDDADRPGNAIVGAVVGGYRFAEGFGARFGVDVRHEAGHEMVHDGETMTHGAGLTTWLSPALVWEPTRDLQLDLVTRVPIVQPTDELRRESVAVAVGVVWTLRSDGPPSVADPSLASTF